MDARTLAGPTMPPMRPSLKRAQKHQLANVAAAKVARVPVPSGPRNPTHAAAVKSRMT